MDDLSMSWPHWKFGLKGDDLFNKLHNEYNTIPSAIQDPEAFHHDVYELSTACSTADDFYRRMADRKMQRLQELNTSLESASLEIIANPSLIGTEQWQYAIQLFRTKSLDSLVRYFSSYLPESHPWSRSDSSSSSFEEDERHSVTTDESNDADSYCPSLFPDAEDKSLFTREPEIIDSEDDVADNDAVDDNSFRRTMTMRSNASTVSTDAETLPDFVFDADTPARSQSFSDSEPDLHIDYTKSMLLHDDASSQSDGPETPAETEDELDIEALDTSQPSDDGLVFDDELKPLSHASSTDSMALETPTPKATPKAAAAGGINPFDMASPLRRCSASRTPLSSSSSTSTLIPRSSSPQRDCRHPHPATVKTRKSTVEDDLVSRRRSLRLVVASTMLTSSSMSTKMTSMTRACRVHRSAAGVCRSSPYSSDWRRRRVGGG